MSAPPHRSMEAIVTKVYFGSSFRNSAPIWTKYTTFFSSLHWEGCERDKYATSYNFAREFLYIWFVAIKHAMLERHWPGRLNC